MKCNQCGAEFQAEKRTAQYCSDKCRVDHSRGVSVTDVSVTMIKAPRGRMRPICRICAVCLYPNWKGELMYPEDKDGVPYCSSSGPLSAKSREILARKPQELEIVRVPKFGP